MLGDTPKAVKRRRRLRDVQTAGRLWKHSTLTDIDGLIETQDFSDFFCFTLVRNPWDRMVSYYHWLQEQSFDHPAVGLAKDLDFSSFLHHAQTRASLQSNPSASYMTAADGGEYCNSFIRIECFEEDADPLFQHLGFRFDLPHSNRSNRQKDFREYYSTQDVDMLSKLCASDIDRFGYGFE